MKRIAFCLSLLLALAGCDKADQVPTPTTVDAPKDVRTSARQAGNQGPTLDAGEYLLVGDYMESTAQPDFTYRQLHLQGDGNLVLYNVSVWPWKVLWQSFTPGLGVDILLMQTDGNLVLYNRQTGAAVWQSGTCCYPAESDIAFSIESVLNDEWEWEFRMLLEEKGGLPTVIKELYRGE